MTRDTITARPMKHGTAFRIGRHMVNTNGLNPGDRVNIEQREDGTWALTRDPRYALYKQGRSLSLVFNASEVQTEGV